MKLSLTFTQTFLKSFLLILTFSIVSSSNIKNSYAIANPGVRGATYTGADDYQCYTSEPDFNPFGSSDMEWELGNPICASYIAASFLSSQGAVMATNKICRAVDGPLDDALMVASSAAGVAFSPAMVAAQIKNGTACATLPPTHPTKIACCVGVASSAIAVSASIGALGIIYAAAKDVHKYARICGHNWYVWKDTSDPKDGIMEYGKLGDWKVHNNYTYSEYDGSYAKYLEDKYKLKRIPSAENKNKVMEDKEYRELLYGGMEYDSGGICKNPDWGNDSEGKSIRKKILGYDSDNQRYYMTGPKNTPNYACERFLLNDNLINRAKGLDAYECCVSNSQKFLCVENRKSTAGFDTYDHKFCELGGARCNIRDIWFDVYESKGSKNYLCAKTFSVCPYNHLLGGGTEVKDVDKDTGVIKNHCQYLKHCAMIPGKTYIRRSNMSGEYIASACYDLKGASQNTYSYNNDLVPINNEHFSAPMAECFHETLYNIFLNRSGHTECVNPEELPDNGGNCESGVKIKAGEVISGKQSFFEKLQRHFYIIIKLVLTAAITVMGYTILLGGQMIPTKDIMMFIMKIGLVLYFTLGNAWQKMFFEGVFNTSTVISGVFMQIDEAKVDVVDISRSNPTTITVADISDINNGDLIKFFDVPQIAAINNKLFTVSNKNESQNSFRIKPEDGTIEVNGSGFDNPGRAKIRLEKRLDGCQFPKFDYADSTSNKYNNPRYPQGKEYLKIFDTLDCKIVRALGFSPGVSVPNFFLFILAGFLTGGLGIVYLFASIIFAFYLLSIAVRALHMFLLSTISIVIMIFISPITITMALFKRTSGIFKGWWTNLFGFVLQPVILFAYLGIMVTIFDYVVAGGATYQGNGYSGPKEISCVGEESKGSVYCIFSKLGIKTNNIEALGIGFPELEVLDPSSGSLKDIVYAMIKAAFIMFIFSSFFSKISEFSAAMVGGQKLNAEGIDVGAAAGGAFGAAKAVQIRGMRGGWKAAKSIGGAIGGKAKGAARAVGSQGKSTAAAESKSAPSDSASDKK